MGPKSCLGDQKGEIAPLTNWPQRNKRPKHLLGALNANPWSLVSWVCAEGTKNRNKKVC